MFQFENDLTSFKLISFSGELVNWKLELEKFKKEEEGRDYGYDGRGRPTRVSTPEFPG